MTNRQSLIQCSECGQTIETGLCDPCQIHATRLAKQRIRDLEAALAAERERHRLANIDALNTEAEANDLRQQLAAERQRADQTEAALKSERELTAEMMKRLNASADAVLEIHVRSGALAIAIERADQAEATAAALREAVAVY
ncbi:MAG: hypothetical protein KGL39_51455, partial [Patescibacteria group bacterium]|nr:hypothetical protein [Patescibacteria group bacterium]